MFCHQSAAAEEVLLQAAAVCTPPLELASLPILTLTSSSHWILFWKALWQLLATIRCLPTLVFSRAWPNPPAVHRSQVDSQLSQVQDQDSEDRLQLRHLFGICHCQYKPEATACQ